MTSTARLRFLVEHDCTVVFATPTYALHLAELAAKEGIDLAGSAVRALVVAGEPGGNIPATRERIEAVWGARVFDHYGMTEVGPVAVEAADQRGHDVPARIRVPRGGAATRTAARRVAGRVRRTRADEPRPRRQPAHPLPHRRPRAGRDRVPTRPAGRGGGSTVASSGGRMI